MNETWLLRIILCVNCHFVVPKNSSNVLGNPEGMEKASLPFASIFVKTWIIWEDIWIGNCWQQGRQEWNANAPTSEFKYHATLEVEKGNRSQAQMAKELVISGRMKMAKWEELEVVLLKWIANAQETRRLTSFFCKPLYMSRNLLMPALMVTKNGSPN